MRKLNLYFAILALAIATVACSDPMDEFDAQLISPDGNPPSSTSNVIPGSITQQIGAAGVGCIEYYVYAIASGGTTVSYDRKVTITIIKDAYTDPNTGIPSQPELLEQYVLTIPAGSSVSPNQRVLADAQEDYDQDFTFKAESITDTAGNPLTGYTLRELTYDITDNCYTNPGNGGGGYTFSDCGFSGSGETSYGTSGGQSCDSFKKF